MDTVAGLHQDPLLELIVSIGELAELAQGEKTAFDVLHACFDPTLLLGIARRAGVDLEAVSLGQLRIGPLHFRIADTGAGNGALRVIDDDP